MESQIDDIWHYRYRQKYSFKLWISTYRLVLPFTAPPAFLDVSKYDETIVLKEGQSTAIEIPFAANPQPEVSWEFNKGALPRGKRFTSDTIYNMTSLCIGRAEAKDAGTYSVVLENQYGKVTLNIKLKVIGKCKMLKWIVSFHIFFENISQR